LARRWVLATCGPLARRGDDGRYGGGGRVPSADAARQQPASPPHSPFWRHRGIGGVGGEDPGRAAAGPFHPAHGPAYRAPCSRGTRSLTAHVQRPARPRRVLRVQWLPTVPLLTFVFLAMNAPAAETVLLNRKLGTASFTMVPLGHPGEVQIGTDWCGIPPFDLTGGTRAIGPVLDLAAETPRYGATVAYHGPERPDRQPIVDVDHEIAVTASRSDDGPRARDSFRRLGSPGRPGPSLSEEYGLLMNTSYPYSDAVHGQWCWCRHPPALLRHGGPRLLQPPGGLARRRPTCPRS
jgi:hypothetical protein